MEIRDPLPPYPPEVAAVEDLLTFISASPSPYHAVAEAARRLADAGYHAVLVGEHLVTSADPAAALAALAVQRRAA